MEFRKRCRVCGKIYCYTDDDVLKNASNSMMAGVSALGGIASIFGGTRLDTYAMSNRADQYSDKVIDFKKCPNCNSTDIEDLTQEMWDEIQDEQQAAGRVITINTNASYEALKTRIVGFIEDRDFASAKAYCNQLLDIKPDDGELYYYLFLATHRLSDRNEDIVGWILREKKSVYDSKQGNSIKKFGPSELNAKIEALEIAAKEARYNEAVSYANNLSDENSLKLASDIFDELGDFKDSEVKKNDCIVAIENVGKDKIYNKAVKKLESASDAYALSGVEDMLKPIVGWRDSEELINRCESLINDKHAEEKKRNEKIKIAIVDVVAVIALAVIGMSVYNNIIAPYRTYLNAKSLYESQEYENAKSEFSSLGNYKDAESWVEECDVQITEIKNKENYDSAIADLEDGNYNDAIEKFTSLDNYSDSTEKLNEAKKMKYDAAMKEYALDNVVGKKLAYEMFTQLGDFEDSEEMATKAETGMYIRMFCTSTSGSKKEKDSINFFTQNVKNGTYKLLTGDEIKSNIIGTWEAFRINKGTVSQCYNKDGSLEWVRLDSETETPFITKWKVEDNVLYYGTLHLNIFEIDENHWLFFKSGEKSLSLRMLSIRE
jgi:hypothetical protein